MTAALKITGLKKTYRGGLVALKGISLEVQQGDFFGLLGPNGAGKTTIIGVIASLVNKTAGRVSIFGHDLDTNPAGAKACLGLVPQEFNFNMFDPVVEVVANQAGYYGIERKESFERAEKYLKHLDLWDKRQVMARNLSGGMKRRLMIARALIHEPRLLILDEPTAGVDIELRRSMWQFLTEINQAGTTIILTTHYLEEAEHLCRNIAIIDEGEIVENTGMKNLLSQLDSQVFILDLISEITELPEDPPEGVSLHKVDNHCIEVGVGGTRDLAVIFSYLGDRGIQVASMRNKTNRLEELFLSKLRDE